MKTVVGQFFHRDATACEVDLLSGAAGGGEQAEFLGWKATLFKELQDDSSDGTCGSGHSNCIKHGSFPGDLSENQR